MIKNEARELKFRAWTGKQMMYQNNQYLASFIRRVVLQICLEHGSAQQHESYLPNGGNIDEYLQQYIGLKDKNGKEIYIGDIVQTTYDFKKIQSKAQVVFEHFTCGIRWLDPQEPSDFGFKPLYDPSNDPDDEGELYWNLSEFEIVGNIYEQVESL